jgi:hypothetical protein
MRFAIALVTLFATFSWFFPAVAMDKGGSYTVLARGQSHAEIGHQNEKSKEHGRFSPGL